MVFPIVTGGRPSISWDVTTLNLFWMRCCLLYPNRSNERWKNHQHNSTHILPSFPRNKFNHNLYVYTRQMFPRFNVSRAWFRASSYNISKWPWKPSKHAMAALHRVTTPISFVVVRHEWMIQLQHCGMTPKNRLAACWSYNLKEIKTSATQKHTHTHIWPDLTLAVAFVSICCSQLSHCWC